MFGHDHKDEDKNNDNVQPMGTQPVHNGLLGIDDDAPSSSSPGLSGPFGAPTTSVNTPSNSFSPSDTPSPSMDEPSSDTPTTAPVSSDGPDEPTTDSDSPNSTDSSFDATPSTAEGDDDLLDIKREALEELSPLIDHLDQDPEEKFRTSMMMIQASDNKSLVPQAFATAKQISDDKKRAQALLDIVNEINYFTHKTDE